MKSHSRQPREGVGNITEMEMDGEIYDESRSVRDVLMTTPDADGSESVSH